MPYYDDPNNSDPTQTPPPTGGGGGGGPTNPADTSGPGLFGDVLNQFAASQGYHLPGVPGYGGSFLGHNMFESLTPFNFANFKPPNASEVASEPGNEYALNELRQQQEQSAAARGDLRTGGTNYAIGQGAASLASQQYSNAYNRALTTYGVNWNNAYKAWEGSELQPWLLRNQIFGQQMLQEPRLAFEAYKFPIEQQTARIGFGV